MSDVMSEKQVIQHYHVDVFVGEDRRYVRGFVLGEMEGGWQILDDMGLAGEREQVLAEGLPLEEALVRALSILHRLFGPPLYPVWRTAPYELVGYVAPKVDLFGRGTLSQLCVGADGRPEARKIDE